MDERTVRHAGYGESVAETSGAIVRVDEDDRDAKESEVARIEKSGGCLPSPELLTTCVDCET